MRKINNKENKSHFIIAYNYLGLKTGVIKNYFIYFIEKVGQVFLTGEVMKVAVKSQKFIII